MVLSVSRTGFCVHARLPHTHGVGSPHLLPRRPLPLADVPSSTISSTGARSLVVPYASCSRTNCRARRKSS